MRIGRAAAVSRMETIGIPRERGVWARSEAAAASYIRLRRIKLGDNFGEIEIWSAIMRKENGVLLNIGPQSY